MTIPELNKIYTFADYLTWPDDERWEILDGTPCMMTAPAWQHQAISSSLTAQFYNYLSGRNSCRVFASSFDLRLPVVEKEKDEDITNVFQPDIILICDPSKLIGYCGVPSLVIEISSPSTGKIDKLVKFNIYEKAGVPEYWIVEPDAKIISVFQLVNGNYGRPMVYSEEDSISIDMFPDLVIDLGRVFEGI